MRALVPYNKYWVGLTPAVLFSPLSYLHHEPRQKRRSVAGMIVIALCYFYYQYCCKQPGRISILGGRDYIKEVLLLDVNATWIYDVFRMPAETVTLLLNELSQQNLLSDSPHVSKEEKLAMSMSIMAKRQSNRIVQERFQHSGEIVSR